MTQNGRATPGPGTGSGTGSGEPARRFPEVSGRSLLGVERRLPGQLPAERTLVVVAFRQWHQPIVDRWIARAVAAGVPPTILGAAGRLPRAVVELPVLSARLRPARRFIDGGMTAGIADPVILARTITVYTNLAAFQRSLGIGSSDELHALVVTPDGSILARAEGEPDEGWGPIGAALAG
jgi:hypothetical protein